MIVVDASILVDLTTRRASPSLAARLRRTDDWHAPVTVDAEVLHALRRHVIAGLLPVVAANDAVLDFQNLAITRHPVQPLVPRMWQLRNNVTAYDAAYIALAETLDAPLVTRDARLARSSGHGAAVELI